MPDSRALGGGLFELRCKGSEGIARVFYGVFSDDRELWLLHAFRKQTQRTPRDDLALAKRRLRALREEKKTKKKG
ncbi:MAG TPA: type II toxin-antitoxin system RelE/ParE family toxin [Thermodesulfobacteriota bacterium]